MSVRDSLEPQHLRRLPVFPLPGVVFFPNTLLPLHVFEPRYRALTTRCLEEDWPMAVALIRPGHEREQAGDPPIEPVAGAGRIVHVRRHPNGRYDIVLEGVERVRLEELPRDTPYRVARAEVIPDQLPSDEAEVRRHIETLRTLVEGLRGLAPGAARVLLRQIAFDRGPGPIADTSAASLFVDPVARQRLLETERVDERLARVVRRLSELIAESAAEDTPSQ